MSDEERPDGPEDVVHQLPPGIESLRKPRRPPEPEPPEPEPAKPEPDPRQREPQPQPKPKPKPKPKPREPSADEGLVSGVYSSVSMRLHEARREGRPVLSGLLNVLGVVLLFAGTFCLFLRHEILDSSRLSDKAVQVVHQDVVRQFLATQATKEAVKRVPELEGTAAVLVVQGAAGAVIGSPEAEPVVRRAVTITDEALLKGGRANVSMQFDNFGALLGAQLTPLAPEVAGQIPNFDEKVATFDPSAALPQVFRAVKDIQLLGLVLPPIALLVLFLGIFFARDRLRGAAGLGVCAVISGAVGFGLLALARGKVLNTTPEGIDRDAAAATWDQVIGPLRTWYLVVAGLGIVIAVVMLVAYRRRSGTAQA